MGLGVNPRTLTRHFEAGLPRLAEGQSEQDWLTAARQWIAERRGKPGPRATAPSPAVQDALDRWRQARAELAELQLQEARGEVHTRSECEAAQVRRLQELRAAFTRLPDLLARRLYQAPSPEAIKVVVEEELRSAFDSLARGDAEPAEEAAAGE